MEQNTGTGNGAPLLGIIQGWYWSLSCTVLASLLSLMDIELQGNHNALLSVFDKVRPLNARFAYALGYNGVCVCVRARHWKFVGCSSLCCD